MNIKVALETLGCKVNQYESSYFLQLLEEAGCKTVGFREHADVYIVHSCAVTSKAGFQTRQLLRRAQRLNPAAKIIVTGCEAQLDSRRIAEEGLATHILGNAEKFDLPKWLQAPGSLSHPLMALSDPRRYDHFPPQPVTRMYSGRARAFLKLQDGCDSFCSYCVIPFTRGKSRSLPAHEVRLQMDRFLDHGYQEVVLTGIHLGQWGKDLEPRQGLAALLEELERSALPPRVRLSSLEPMEWTDELLHYLTSRQWICPHFHVPLQSGDDEILERMHRPYKAHQYEELVRELHFLFPRAAIGADVLVGFPGETEEHFQNTFELLNRLPISYMHVFPFSPRPGTLAAKWPGRVTGNELKRRARLLHRLSAAKRQTFRERFMGETIEVLAESQVKPGWWQGTSRNYLQIFFPAPCDLPPGSLVSVRIRRLTGEGVMGEMVLNPH
ncbi:tRNA (N(6)-L-threonylcarbamoyladenosine(37)-C(2))-methylthiotransferase MtaB [Desulforhabdus amnigena]|uniref:tRNA (N(6)-L-threonylcarbamoyladenosine(37)-C(2))-methylthiotransferase n=1 Tax=Desulforhabdus amnigena TaxID=40218 RepID=A0A9W6D6G0_9BACT|nr:tRNA (N(6)-L-threonylcarbamoyladenosine(37)-C(2))-methylthiotransferase MtaB [Desulforhabdus amnigena]GLI34526.1 tRNA (N(6)-L-threonylcarbamoyladenosine(37)-C(2))-methylthiotransferase MtaB [Desulforhabdus amnigena]